MLVKPIAFNGHRLITLDDFSVLLHENIKQTFIKF